MEYSLLGVLNIRGKGVGRLGVDPACFTVSEDSRR